MAVPYSCLARPWDLALPSPGCLRFQTHAAVLPAVCVRLCCVLRGATRGLTLPCAVCAPAAQFMVGYFYEMGRSVEKSLHKAMTW